MDSIRDQFAFNIDVYPKTLNNAYKLMENHSTMHTLPTRYHDRGNLHGRGRGNGRHGGGRIGGRGGRGNDHRISGMQFHQLAIVASNDGRTLANIKCYGCNKRGHYSTNCPEMTEQGTTQLSDAVEDNTIQEEGHQSHINTVELPARTVMMNPSS